MKRWGVILTFFCIVLFAPVTRAQLMQPLRYEESDRSTDNDYVIVGLEQDGIALVRDLEKYKDGNPQWQFILLDTLLNKTQSVNFDINSRENFAGYDHTRGKFHLLFKSPDQTTTTLELITFDLSSGQVSHYDIKVGLSIELTHFYMVGMHAIFGGYVNREPTVILYDPSLNQLKVLPGFIQEDVNLMDVRVNENNTFDVVLANRLSKGDRQIIFKTFDENGVELLQDHAPIESNRTIQTAISSRLLREDLMVVGTWGNQNAKQSLGFYTMTIDPYHDNKINYFYSSDFDHFLDFINAKRAERIKTKTQKAVKDGRAPDFTNYIAPFELGENEHGYLMLAQVYSTSVGTHTDPYGQSYPDYRYYGNYYGGLYNPYYRYPGLYPDPYGFEDRRSNEIKTYEIALIAFDGQGKHLWDVSVKPEEIKTLSLTQVGEFYYAGDSVFLMYRDESKLHVQAVDLKDETVSQHSIPLKLKSDTDVLRSERDNKGTFEHWYNNVYFASGYQTIKNTTNKEDRVRDVFYINKIVVP